MKQRVAITIDVEAQPARAGKDHIDRLIWGKLTGPRFGLSTMMSMASHYDIRLTCFLDYVERELYGEALLDVGREILRRGHDLQLHQHPDFFSENFWRHQGQKRLQDLCQSDKDQCRASVDYILDAHSRVTSRSPLAYRSGGYRLSWPLLEVLGESGIRLDASYNPQMERNPLGMAFHAPFFWSNGLFEVPVPCLLHFHNRPIMPYNFNSPALLNGSLEQCLQQHTEYLNAFFTRYGNYSIATLVMHSWSFYQLDEKGFFTIRRPDAIAKFDALLALFHEKYEVVALGGVATQLEKENERTWTEHLELGSGEACCPICRTPVSHFTDLHAIGKRHCPICKSVERHRIFYDLYQQGIFGEQILNHKKILHIAPGAAEKSILKHIPCEVTSLDIRPDVKPDILANISEMPEVTDESFDVILCSFVFTCTERFAEALAELHRVLRPGGFILCHDPLRPGQTKALSEHSHIIAYYGKEAYDAWHVGKFRSFGEQDYVDWFQPCFDAALYFGTDQATGMRQGWLKAIKREELTEKILRDGAHIFLEPATDSLVSLFPPALGYRHHKQFLEQKTVTDDNIKETFNILKTLMFSFLSTEKMEPTKRELPHFLKDYPEQKNPYSELSFKSLFPWIEHVLHNPQENILPIVLFCIKRIKEWKSCFGFYKDRNNLSKHTYMIAWYDAATSTRLLYITFFIQYIIKNKINICIDDCNILFRMAIDHLFTLAMDKFYNHRTNHGMFQNFALLNFTYQFPELNCSSIVKKIVENRIISMLHERLSVEGILNEHSPYYHIFFFSSHLILSKTLQLHKNFYDTIMPYIKKLANSTEGFLYSEKMLAPVGDSPSNYILPEDIYLSIKQYQEKNQESIRICKSAGYARIRTTNKHHESYCLLCGAFHSRTHKHCDDLSFIWSEGNRNLLVDTGMRYQSDRLPPDNPLFAKGFWYSNPEQIYAESPNAHNMVEINGEPYSRTVEPYGALPLRGGTLAIHQFFLAGCWNRPDLYRQKRMLILHPGRWLLVLDALSPSVPHPAETSFSQWFQLDPAARMLPVTNKALETPSSTLCFDVDGAHLYCTTLLPARVTSHRGETLPRRQGWNAVTFESMAPSWSVGVHQQGPRGDFATLFSLDTRCDQAHIIWDDKGERLSRLALTFSDGSRESIDLPPLTSAFSITESISRAEKSPRQRRGKLTITIDTEAHTLRAEKDHVRRLIWGECDEGEYGLRRMMDIADRYGAKLTSFLDFPEYDTYGSDILDVGREVLRRGHDLQIHMHPEMFSPDFFQRYHLQATGVVFPYLETGKSIAEHIRTGRQAWDPGQASKESLLRSIDACLDIYSRITAKAPSAFRTMGYKLTPDLIEALGTASIPISCNYNPSFPDRAPFLKGILPPFYWHTGMLELPVSCILRPGGRRIEQLNFNTNILLNGQIETNIRHYIDFLNYFYNSYRENTIAIMVLHSWSFFLMDNNGHFSIPNEHAVETFEAVLKELSQHIDFITLEDIAQQKNVFFPPTLHQVL